MKSGPGTRTAGRFLLEDHHTEDILLNPEWSDMGEAHAPGF